MGVRLFRYLFENAANAMIMSGCIWDKGVQEQMRYVYTCESSYFPAEQKNLSEDGQMLYHGSPIHLFVMGSFSYEDAVRLLHAIRHDTVETVVLPYVAPVQRFLIMSNMMEQGIRDAELIKFIQAPYLYLKNTAVKKIFFLYGNGKAYEQTEDEMYPGIYFKIQDQKILDMIEEMEGYPIPVMKAGHMINNRMLFLFGYFGVDLYRIRHFLFHYAKNVRFEKIDEREIKKMLLAYRKAFGGFEMDTLTMFCSPVEIIATQTDCVLNTIVIDKDDFCHADIEGDDGRCSVRCMLYNDYDVCRCHRTSQAELRAGVLLLGNICLKKHFEELKRYYRTVYEQIRAITIPNCGNILNWDSSLLDMDVEKNAVFWICPFGTQLQNQVLREIKVKNARNRIIALNEKYGCCFNGFLTEKEE